MKRVIRGAEDNKTSDAFKDELSNIQDDFDYLVDGLDKMARDGKTSEALQIVLEAKSVVNGLISKIDVTDNKVESSTKVSADKDIRVPYSYDPDDPYIYQVQSDGGILVEEFEDENDALRYAREHDVRYVVAVPKPDRQDIDGEIVIWENIADWFSEVDGDVINAELTNNNIDITFNNTFSDDMLDVIDDELQRVIEDNGLNVLDSGIVGHNIFWYNV